MPEYPSPNFGEDLLRIHAVITRGLAVATEKSLSFAQQGFHSEDIWEGFLDYVRTLVTVIHAHHLVEDEVTFPQARARLPHAPYDMLSAQHLAMMPIMEEVDATIKETAALPQVSEPVYAMHETLKKVLEIWQPHIRIEEEHFTPAQVAMLFNLDERAKISASIAEHNKEHATPDYLVIPFVLFNLAPADRAAFGQMLPPIVTQQLVPIVWKEKWEPMKPFLLE
jgi:hypothetical protein